MQKNLLIKAISLFLAIILCIPIFYLPSQALEYTDSEGITWSYTVNPDNTSATITKCSKLTGDIVIPSKIDGYSITAIGPSSFFKSQLTKIIIPDSVTSIGDSAFYYCNNLTNANIPEKVIFIGNNAFHGCANLTNINIPNSITSISAGAFARCESVTTINIPNSVLSISEVAFYGCTNLTSITIPNSVNSIGNEAFRYCSKLASITIPNGVRSIGYNTFLGCTSLTSITLPESVSCINSGAFYDCTSLTSINIPKYVNNLTTMTFKGCVNLTTVFFNCDPPKIESDAFSNIDLTKLTLRYLNGITDWSSNGNSTYTSNGVTYNTAPWNGNGIEYIINPDGETATITLMPAVSNNIIIPASIDGHTITTLGVNTTLNIFGGSSNSNVTSITIPNSVKSIGQMAFARCTSLEQVSGGDGLKTINMFAFQNCTALKNFYIPNSVTSISRAAFSGCTNLTSINIPSSMTSINKYVFRGCTGLQNITIPNNITTIGDNAFNGCTNLTSLNLPDSVTSIGNSAFSGCTGLRSINIPNRITTISSNTFSDCANLTTVNFNGIAPSIDATAFSGVALANLTFSYPAGASGWPTEGNIYTSNGVSYNLIIPEPIKYIVTFNSKGGTSINSQTIISGNKVTKPSDPTRNGFTFAGWYSDNSCTTAWDFENATVSSNCELFAKWTPTDPVTPTNPSEPSTPTNPNTQESNTAGSSSTIPISVNANACIFKVVVPLSLPVHVSNSGSVTTANNAKVTNFSSYGMVSVKSITVTGNSGWSLFSYSDDFANRKVNAKAFGFSFNGKEASESNGIVDMSGASAFNVNESLPLTYHFKLAPQASGINNESLANVVVVVGWY